MPEWLTFSVFKDVILAVVALYGAILSTFNWRQASKKEQRLLRITHSAVALTYSREVGSPWIRFDVTNVGHRPVTIMEIGCPAPLSPHHVTISASITDRSMTPDRLAAPVTLEPSPPMTEGLQFEPGDVPTSPW